MKDEFSNRLTMFKTARDLLNLPERNPVWLNVNPTIFTTKVAALDPAITVFEAYCQAQGVDTTGAAVDKDKEETDVETVGHTLGRLLVQWFRDQSDETNAAKCDLSPTKRSGLRDTILIPKAREIRDLALPIAATPERFAYGITSSLVQQLTTEVNEYEQALTTPQTTIAQRKARTLGLRPGFNKVEARFESIDDLILAFNTTEAGHGPTPLPAPPTQ